MQWLRWRRLRGTSRPRTPQPLPGRRQGLAVDSPYGALILIVETLGVGVAIGRSAFVVVILLMVVFGDIEWCIFIDFGYNFESFIEEDTHEFFGDLALFIVEDEDGGAVLMTDIGTLAVELGGIVGFEEEFAKGFVVGFARIENHAYGFGMTGGSGANLFIGRIFNVSANVAHFRGNNALGAHEVVLGAPEATGGEDGSISILTHCRCSVFLGYEGGVSTRVTGADTDDKREKKV